MTRFWESDNLDPRRGSDRWITEPRWALFPGPRYVGAFVAAGIYSDTYFARNVLAARLAAETTSGVVRAASRALVPCP